MSPISMVLLGVSLLLSPVDTPREIRSAENRVPTDSPVGQPPYEMVRAGRTERRPALVPFEDLRGWTVELYGNAVASLERTREQRVWGEHAARLTYRGAPGENTILLRPPRPLPIPGRFTAVNIWVFGNNWGWVRRPDTPQVELALRLLDRDGLEHRVSLDRVRWEEWWLVHRRVVNHLGDSPSFPFSLAAIEVRGGYQPEDRVLYLDSISFYEEEWPPLSFQPRPRRNIDPFLGQSHGLNTGPGRLPFPMREETILPSNLTGESTTETEAIGDEAFAFHYRGVDARITYEVRPRPEGLGSVEVSIDGRPAGGALREAGVRLADLSGGEARLDRVHLAGDVLEVRQVIEGSGREVTVDLHYRLLGKSLVVDVICPGGEAKQLDLGAMDGVAGPRAIPVPFANYGGQSHVLLARAGDRPFFASVWIDWYRSNASELYTAREVEARRARINGGSLYRPRTDGRRNGLFERLFLTYSPVFEETLPTIDNPPARWGQLAGEHLWQESWGPANFEKEKARSRRLRAHGITRLIQCNHEIAWRDNADSFTLRIHAAPGKGGDEALADYVGHQKSLGWRSGLYSNYTDFAPVNENWDENAVQLEPDREWRRAWPRCYALKPARAVELDARYAPRIKKRYDPNSAYTDVHTAVAPWRYCDYDARVPGAGTFAATFYAYGELLLNDSRVYGGPIFSEGTYQCLYAGLPDGNYALHYGGYDFAREPILPQFDLLKIHPLSADIGMGWTSNFCTWPGWNRPENLSASIDRFIMTTMAYGHIGWLVEEAHGMELVCRSYYTLQQVTKRYAMRPPRSIEYFDGKNLVSSSEAIATGAHRASMLRIDYGDDLELWLNGSHEKKWVLPDRARGLSLPPAGWLARSADGALIAESALRGGRRYDRVVSPEYLYADGRGELQWFDEIATAGCVAVRAPNPHRLEVIVVGQHREVGLGGPGLAIARPSGHIASRLAAVLAAGPLHAEALDEDGSALGGVEIRPSRGRQWLLPVKSGLRYTLSPAEGPPADDRLVIDCDLEEVLPGEVVPIRVSHDGQPVDAGALHGLWDDSTLPLRRIAGGQGGAASFRVPGTATPGETAWLRVEADGESKAQTFSGWLIVSVRPIAELELRPPVLRLRDGRGTIRLVGRLGLEGRRARLRFAPPPGVRIDPPELEASGGVDRQLVVISPEPSPGRLRLVPSISGSEQVISYDLIPGKTRPEVARLGDGSVPFAWSQALRGGTEAPGDPASGATFHVEKAIPCGGVTRPGLFSHPPYRGGVGYTAATFEPIVLPPRAAELHIWIGLKDGGDPSDGVDFVVEVLPEDGPRREILREHTGERDWREVNADLSEWAGQTVRLRLVADVGPADSSTSDWAAWGEPVVRLRDPVPTLTFRRAEGG